MMTKHHMTFPYVYTARAHIITIVEISIDQHTKQMGKFKYSK